MVLDELVSDFLIESHENLDQMDLELVALEEDSDPARLATIFRNIHTIKGNCGFLDFPHLERVAHAGESLMSRLRDGVVEPTTEIATALLGMVDAIRGILRHIEASGEESGESHDALIDLLTALSEGQLAPKTTAPEAPQVEADTGGAPLAETNVRVDVALLDKLMNLVGELVLARNQTLQVAARLDDSAFSATTQRLNLITTELQESVMKTRMQPIGQVWRMLPRVVRDLSLALEKQVRVEMEGEDTDLDRTLIEAIKDPMTHLVRNAVDHAFETPMERACQGKPPECRLLLRAFHEGGQVNIEISDDGRGIDPALIRRKAVERALMTQTQAEQLSDREAVGLIFSPGFSTADAVTNLSGRGVGMDVVKTNIEKIGGTIDIASTKGRGTTFKIKIPLTLAIIPALIVRCRGERFAIPQVSLLELVQLEGRIESLHGTPVYRLRGRLLPVVYLDKQLGMESWGGDAPERAGTLMVVVQADGQKFGLVVDTVEDTEEIVVKPLSRQLGDLSCFSGATIMGDGHVALILDVLGLARASNVISDNPPVVIEEAPQRDDEALETLLLFHLHSGRDRFAMPLSLVARLEEFERGEVEHAGALELVQYRDQLMPLVHLNQIFPERRIPDHRDDGETLKVVVYTNGGRSAGLVVGRIADIVQEALNITARGSRPGVEATAVVQGKVTELLAVEEVIRMAVPGFFESHRAA